MGGASCGVLEAESVEVEMTVRLPSPNGDACAFGTAQRAIAQSAPFPEEAIACLRSMSSYELRVADRGISRRYVYAKCKIARLSL